MSKPWNRVEIINIAITGFVPIIILVLGLLFNHRQTQVDDRKDKQEAVQNVAKSIYERRTRAELLLSSIRRNVSKEELYLRKNQYDEAYFKWNRDHQANLLIVRSVIDETSYSHIESVIEFNLVSNIFKPLDRCLTNGYDHRIVSGESGEDILKKCGANYLLRMALDCGYAITNELHKVTSSVTEFQIEKSNSIISTECSRKVSI